MVKTADTKTSARTASKNNGQPFFGKESESSFFSKEAVTTAPFFVQRKLNIGKPDDHFEREADAVADKVVQQNVDTGTVQAKPVINPASITAITQLKSDNSLGGEKEDTGENDDKIQMKAIIKNYGVAGDDDNKMQKKWANGDKQEGFQKAESQNMPQVQLKAIFESNEEHPIQRKSNHESGSTPDLQSKINTSKESGDALSPDTRSFMEGSIGADFSGIKIHTDNQAVQMSKDLGAQAFTHGNDIYFNEGKYDDSSNTGKHLLAHELTHTIQQQGNSSINNADLLQKETDDRTNRQIITEALTSKDSDEIDDITNFKEANVTERISLVGIILDNIWVGSTDEANLKKIWESFDDLPATALANMQLFKDCIKRGADLGELTVVKKIRETFKQDVEDKATEYLRLNRKYVLEEMHSLGLPGSTIEGQKEPTKDEQDDRLKEIQTVATTVATAQEEVRQLRNIIVGRSYVEDRAATGAWPVTTYVTFDPEKQPDKEISEEDIQNHKGRKWQEVHDYWKAPSTAITKAANLYPTIYASIQASEPGLFEGPNDVENKVAKISDEKNPENARQLISMVLTGQLKNIDAAQVTLDTKHKPEYYKFDPIHRQFFAGLDSKSGTNWKGEFNQWAANQDLEVNKDRDFWADLALSSAALAAFVVIEIASAGSATFFLAAGIGMGLAATGTKAVLAWDDYVKLAAASKAAVKDETQLVDRKQVIQAEERALAATAEFIAMLAASTVKGVSAIQRKPKAETKIEPQDGGNKQNPLIPKSGQKSDPPPEVMDKVVSTNDGGYRLNRKKINNGFKIEGQPEARDGNLAGGGGVQKNQGDAAREAYAAELAAGRNNVDKVYMGDAANKKINGNVNDLSVDVVAVTKKEQYYLYEAKGANIEHGLEQLEHSANALGKERVIGMELVLPKRIQPGFKVENGILHSLNPETGTFKPHLVVGKQVKVKFTNTGTD